MAKDEGFLSRWSRLKQTPAAPDPDLPHEAAPAAGRAENSAPAVATPTDPAAAAPRELPPLDAISADSDFTPFMQPDISEPVRQRALKQLFADPHFNIMDGLDIHIEDYTQPDPLPTGMLERLAQAQIFLEKAEAATIPSPGTQAGPQASETLGENDKEPNVQNVSPDPGE